MTIQTENLCEKCIDEKRPATYPECLNCDHRVNKIANHNNFRPKKSAFQVWNGSAPVPMDDTWRTINRKDGWNGFADSLRETLGREPNIQDIVFDMIERLKEP